MRRSWAAIGIAAAFLAGSVGLAAAPGSAQDGDLQALIQAAPVGARIVLPAGTYAGPIVIDRPLTVESEEGAMIVGTGEGSVVTIAADDVTLRGLTVRGSGISNDTEDAGVSATGRNLVIEDNTLTDVLFGIYLRQSPGSIVRGNEVGAKDLEPGRRGDGIRLWESAGSTVERNAVDGGRDLVMWYSNGLVVRDNTVTNGRYGLHFMYSDDVVVEGNRLSGNSVGAFLMYSRRFTFVDNHVSGNNGPSGYGLGLKDIDGAEVHDNTFVENRIGVYLDNSPTSPDVRQHFTGNVFAYNDVGVTLLPSVRRNVFSENAFVDNREQVARQGDGVLRDNIWTIDGRGNYWSDYAGYDADQNGIGDIHYRIEDLFAQVTDERPDLRLLSETPAAKVVDAAAKAFPTMRPDPKVIDDAPLVQPPMAAKHGGSLPAVQIITALALLTAGLLPTLAARRPRAEVAT